jgi:hypothetical protein
MFKIMIALAIASAMSGPAFAQADAQAQPQASADATQAEQPQPQMVKKCRRVPDYPSSGTMLGPTHQECKMVPAKGSGSTAGQHGGDGRDGGKK